MKSKNKHTKSILIILLLCITIGYAAIRSGLNINGTTHVSGATWDVHFENYQASSGSVTPTTEPSTTGNPTTVTYEVTLTNPGDYYEFTIDAVNAGSLDVMIESFSSKLNGVEITPSTLPPYLSYSATYSDGLALQNKQQLLHGTRETLKLKVAYRDDIPTTDLPSTIQDLSFSFTITYVQADSSAIPVIHTFTGTKYTVNIYDEESSEHNAVWIGRTMPSTINFYSTAAEARTHYTIWPTYLKHTIVNDVVTESYVVFVIDNDSKAFMKSVVCNYEDDPPYQAECEAKVDTLVNGTYTLRGGVDERSETNQPVYEANKNVLKQAFNYSSNPSVCATYGKDEDHDYESFECGADFDIIGDAYTDGFASFYAYTGDGRGCEVTDTTNGLYKYSDC